MFNWMLARKLDRIGRRANPDREFVRALERRISANLGKKRHLSTAFRLAAGSLAGMTLLFGSTAAYAYTSDDVLPDHPLYPLRETIEQAEDALAPTPQIRAAVRLNLVQRKLKERLLLDAKQKPVTREQVQKFVKNVEAAIDANGGLKEDKREEFDRSTARAEAVYADALENAKEKTGNTEEKKKIDAIIETQTGILDERVKMLQEKRREQFKKLMERRKAILEQRRARLLEIQKTEEEAEVRDASGR